MPTCSVTRRVHFNAAHRLYVASRSEEWNAQTFGMCANPNFHGHNYELDVTVAGEIDPETGYVIDINVLKRLVEAKLLSQLDHRNLNLDVPYFKDVNPTAENLVVYCWQTLAPLIPVGTLRRLRLWETPRIYVDYEG